MQGQLGSQLCSTRGGPGEQDEPGEDCQRALLGLPGRGTAE